jgi:hypothetical protein
MESVTQNKASAFTTTCGQSFINIDPQIDVSANPRTKTYVCAATSQAHPPKLTSMHCDQDENVDTRCGQGDKCGTSGNRISTVNARQKIRT